MKVSSKFQHLVVPPLLFVALALKIASMDIYIPCMPFLTRYFDTQEWVIQFSLMLSPLLSSVTALFYGRWTDLYGRRKTILVSLLVFTVGSLGCALSSDIHTFLFCRTIQAAGSGGMSVLTLVILSDLFQGIAYARYIATYNTMFPITFAIAPVLGAQLFEHFSWQMNFWVLVAVAVGVTISLYFVLDETLPTNSHQQTSVTSVWTKSFSLFNNSYFMTMSLGHCLPIAIACIYTTNSAFLFIDHLEFSPVDFSYIQLIPVGINFLGAIAYRQFLPKLGMERSLQIGLLSLYLFISGAIFCLLSPHGNLPFSILGTICLLNFGLSFCISTCATWAYESSPQDKGVAIALVALMRNGLIAGLVMVAALFYNGTITPVFLSMVSLGLVVLLILKRGLLLTKRLSVEF